MNRDDAVSLLRELVAAFESLAAVPAVSMVKAEGSGGWELHVKWTPARLERDRLSSIAAKHGLTITEAKDYTVFR